MTMDIPELVARIEAAEDQFDECPECGHPFVDVDAITGDGGQLVFIHEENDVSVDGCNHPAQEVEVDG